MLTYWLDWGLEVHDAAWQVELSNGMQDKTMIPLLQKL